jgi:hypothetical protein
MLLIGLKNMVVGKKAKSTTLAAGRRLVDQAGPESQ